MHITNIEKLPCKKNRIYIDGEFAFMLYDKDMGIYHITNAYSDGLDEDQEISEELYGRIIKETVARRARQKSVAMLERMDRTEDELKKRLKLDMYPDGVIQDTLEWLKDLHYLDDSRYAQSYIRNHIGDQSRQALKAKLLAKGIKKETFEEAYRICGEELDVRSEKNAGGVECGKEDSEGAADPEQQAAVKTLRKKLGSKKTLTPKERMNAIGYMLRRGFRRNEITAAFEALDISCGYDDYMEAEDYE